VIKDNDEADFKTLDIPILLIVLLVVGAGFCASQPVSKIPPSSWSEDVNLTNNTGDSKYPSAAIDDNVIHLVWQDDRDGGYEIYYKRSMNNGGTWEEQRLTSYSGNSVYPAVAVNGSNVHVVWQDDRDGGNCIYYMSSNDYGENWDFGDVKKLYPSWQAEHPRIAVNGSNLYVVWQEYIYYDCYNVYFMMSKNNGETWEDGNGNTDQAYVLSENNSRSPAIAVNNTIHVVWQEKRSYNWEIYYSRSSDNGETWNETRISNGNGSSEEPEIAVDNTVHVVWEDNRDGNPEIYYNCSDGEWLDTDVRLTNDSHYSKNPSIAVKENNVSVVWQDNRDGNLEIYYKKCVNSLWYNDTRLTYTGACTSECPVIVLSSIAHVFWDDIVTGNFEIWYKHTIGPYYGVFLLCEDSQHIIGINASTKYNITVFNTGNQNDTVNITMNTDGLPENWSAVLSDNSVSLSPGNSTNITLTVTSFYPDVNSYAYIVIAGISQNDSGKSCSVFTLTKLESLYGVLLSCQDNIHSVDPNNYTVYTITVHNRGNVNDTIDLLYLNKPYGWKANLSSYSVIVEVNSSVNVALYVKPPDMETGKAEIKVRGTSRNDPGKSDYVTTITVVPRFGIYLECPDNRHYIDPGNTTNYTLIVKNLADSDYNITVDLEYPGKWNATLSQNSTYLRVGETAEITVTVTVPENEEAYNQSIIFVKAEAWRYEAEQTIITVVNQVYSITVICNDAFYAGPGETLNIMLNISNNGNHEDVVDFTSLSSWNVTIPDSATLDAKESKIVNISVTVPSDAFAGNHSLNINIAGKGSSFLLQLNIIVKQYYNVRFICPEKNKTSTPNSIANFTVNITNNGNGNDTVTFTSNSSWLQNTSTIIPPRTSKNMTLTVIIPENTPLGVYNFTVIGIGKFNITIFNVGIRVSAPDLKLTRIELSNQNPSEKELITINVFVSNNGDMPANNVRVGFYVDDIFVSNSTAILILPAGKDGVVVFVWYAEPGTHELKFTADPENSINEPDEENNIKTHAVNVKGEETHYWVIYLAAAVMVIIGIVVILRKIYSRRQK
jgi:uncharacterized membrane protein